jgi:hypothetical protein
MFCVGNKQNIILKFLRCSKVFENKKTYDFLRLLYSDLEWILNMKFSEKVKCIDRDSETEHL